MELTVKARLLLLGILPREGDLASLKILRKLRESLSFDEAELKAIGLKNEAGNYHWNPEAPTKEIDIGEKATDIIAQRLKKLDGDKQLTDELVDIWSLFIKD